MAEPEDRVDRAPGAEPAPGDPGAPPEPTGVLAVLGELEIAHEELRVAELELARNRRQVREMIEQHETGQRWREHLFALLPAGVVVTDGMGLVMEANDTAAAILGVRPSLLARKPLPVYVDAADRRMVRDLIAELVRGEPELRATVALQVRGGEKRSVELIGLRDPAVTPAVIRWLLMPSTRPVRAPSAEPGPPGEGDEGVRIAATIARLCGLTADTSEPQRLLTDIAVTARSALPDGTAVSVTLGDPLAPDRLATDSTEAQRLDGLQLQTGEGPGVEAYLSGMDVVVTDLTDDGRWPRLARASRAQVLRSVLALPIRSGDQRAGVVALYGRTPGLFSSDQAVRVGDIVAASVAAVLRAVNERSSLQALVHHLERALSSRAVIEQAKGMVMAQFGGTADEAFARLVAYSTRNNVKLRDLAALIVEGGGTRRLQGL
jgi:GAF domain-containing protein